jgi:two-component system, OmpR family, sensor kinase
MIALRTWSLRSRLTLGIILLTAFGFILSSFVARQALEGYLVGQIDNQLTTLTKSSLPIIAAAGIVQEEEEEKFEHRQEGRGREERDARPRNPFSRIPTATSVTVLDVNGNITGTLGGDLNSVRAADYLNGLTLQEILEENGEPFTLEGDNQSFRAVAVPLPDNSGSIVAAQSLRELDRTIGQLGFFFTLIGLLLLTLIAIAARIVIKVGMRPLEDVEVTAEQIAGGDLSARMPDANPNTEVGRLVASLNSMLTRIETSFAARKESEDKLRRFVADASHELRTPLTAIRGFSELYRQGAVTGEDATRELLGRIEDESKRMGSLIEDLLLLARLDQSREMVMKPVNLVNLVDSAVISARAAGANHPVTFVKPGEEIFALGDESRIHQVVANLLANARTHTPAGTEIEVSLSQSADGVRISVSDNGPGMSFDDQKKIFERFYRADTSRTRVDGEGSGLGLSIVDAVMKAHNGSVTVVSEPGKGATFTLFFPLAQ